MNIKNFPILIRDFLIFAGGIERDQWYEMGKYVGIFLDTLKIGATLQSDFIAIPLFKDIDSIDI